MNSQDNAQQLMQKAEEADADFDFSLAYRLFIQAANEFDKLQNTNEANVCLVRAATCLEKFQVWRGHSALWEYFGNRLGNLVNPDYKFTNPNNPGQSGMYHIISWQEWKRPENGYYSDIKSEQLHQQAWAYMWGAEEAEAEQRHGLAGKLFRKSAISWELSKWGERVSDQTDDTWTKEKIEERYGNKWRLAARLYFKAVYNYIQDKGKSFEEAKLFVSYKPYQVGWGSKESSGSEAVYEKADDVERMIRCWGNYGRAKKDMVKALQECCRQLSILQEQLAHTGRREDQKWIYQTKKKIEYQIEKIHGSWLSYLYHWLSYQLTGSGSSLKRTALSIVPLYVLIFPLIYLSGSYFKHGNNPSIPINFTDAILFSLSNAVSISVSDYTVEGLLGFIVQIINSLSALLFIGYIVWLMTRSSFED